MTKQEIIDLIRLFENSSLCSMKLSDGGFSIELNKTSAVVPAVQPAAVDAVPAVSAQPMEPKQDQQHAITAPLVGTFYAAPAPGEAPFVAVGDHVKKGQTVCLIEAMKMLSEIPAPCDCIITEVLKDNGALTAFGDPIFGYTPC